jgi:hypothetical protein
MGKLTSKERNKLPDSAFAGPGRSFPVNDRGHAKAAIGRASEYHPELKAKIRAKVAKKFPDMKLGD